MTLVRRRGSINIYDYPEHLNPFREEHDVSIGNKHRTFGSRGERAGSFRNAWNFITTTKSKIGRSHSLSRDSSPVSSTQETWTLVSPRVRQSRALSQQNSPPPRPPPPQKTPPVTPRNIEHVTASTPSPDSSDQRYGSLRPKKRRAPPPPSLSSRQASRTSLSSADTTESSGNVHSPSVKSQDSDISEILTMSELANKIHEEFHTDSSDEIEKTSTSNENTKEIETEVKNSKNILTEISDSNRIVTETQVPHNETSTHNDELEGCSDKEVQNGEICDLSVNKKDNDKNISTTYIENDNEKERQTEEAALPVLKIVESDEEPAENNSYTSEIKVEVKTTSNNFDKNEDKEVTFVTVNSDDSQVCKEEVIIESGKSSETRLDYKSAEKTESHMENINENGCSKDKEDTVHAITSNIKEIRNESSATIDNLQNNNRKAANSENLIIVKNNLHDIDNEAEESPIATNRPTRALSVNEYVKKYEMASNNASNKEIPVTRVTITTKEIIPATGRTTSEIKQNGTLNRNVPAKTIIKVPANGTLNNSNEKSGNNERIAPTPAARTTPKPTPRKKKLSISKFFSK